MHYNKVEHLRVVVEGVQILAVLVRLVAVLLLGLGLVQVLAGVKLLYLQRVLKLFQLVGEPGKYYVYVK